ncbi:MAG: HNH endonuclease signature motif containing protein, partial [Microbacteriaceae bacterium]
LPDDPAVWAEYDAKLAPLACTANPARMRLLARSLAEKLAAEPLTVRHARARTDRRVWLQAAEDGMAFGDLLTGDGTEYEVKAAVSTTVPVLTAIGQPGPQSQSGPQSQGLQPGVLNGYGPIDPDTARRLAGKAPSFFRILTHPVTSAILDVDRTSYRVPADLKRWILATHTYCVFPGCNRLATDCDIDHSLDWGHLGTTRDGNLAPLCRASHRLKHNSRWTIIRDTDGNIRWRSPLGHEHNTDPPPF